MEQLTENWRSIEFPMISVGHGVWANRNQTLSKLKQLLAATEMKMYRDFVFHVNVEYKDYRSVSIKFKDIDQGLIVFIQWMGCYQQREQ